MRKRPEPRPVHRVVGSEAAPFGAPPVYRLAGSEGAPFGATTTGDILTRPSAELYRRGRGYATVRILTYALTAGSIAGTAGVAMVCAASYRPALHDLQSAAAAPIAAAEEGRTAQAPAATATPSTVAPPPVHPASPTSPASAPVSPPTATPQPSPTPQGLSASQIPFKTLRIFGHTLLASPTPKAAPAESTPAATSSPSPAG